MKTLLLALVTLIIVSCNLNQNRINENDVSDASSNIDTVFIKDSVIEKYNYEIVESFYPQIRNLTNNRFISQINNNLKDYFVSIISNKLLYIDSINSIYGISKTDTDIDETKMENWPAGLSCSFDILSNKDYIISLIQYFSETAGGGGNGFSTTFKIYNINTEEETILNNKDLNISSLELKLINNRIITFFDKMFPGDRLSGEIYYPTLDKKDEIDQLNYAIRNDSIMLVMEATPTAGYSHSIYIIPIDKYIR